MEPEHHWMRERMPFAVVGSNMTITDPSTGQMYRGREYPWGCVNIEDKVGPGPGPSLGSSERLPSVFISLRKPKLARVWSADFTAQLQFGVILIIFTTSVVGF